MDEVNFLETFSAAREDGLERLSTLLYHVTSWLDTPLDDLLARGAIVLLLLFFVMIPLLVYFATACFRCLYWCARCGRGSGKSPTTPRKQVPASQLDEPSASLSPSPRRLEQHVDPELLRKMRSPFHDKPAKLVEMIRDNFAKETVIEAAKAFVEYTGGEGRGLVRTEVLKGKSTSIAVRVQTCIDADVVQHLCYALHSFARESEMLTEHVSRALRNISFDERGAAECNRAGAPEAICYALKLHGRTETSVCVEGASALYNIAYFFPASRTGIIGHGAVPLLVDMINVHGGVVADVAMFASKAIRSLATDGRLTDIFKSANAAAALVRAFESLRLKGNLDGLLEVRQEINRALRALNHRELS